ncbi:MAG: mannose-1-phosphate guanylyltransferase [Flavobacteriaceae bacterium]
MNTDYYAILMAGGVGSRFWPVSTADFPKQFHDMLGTGETLLQKTFSRLSKLIPAENILILTNERYNDLVLSQLNISPNQVVLEPAMRNTAPCILYASMKIQKLNPKAQILVAPSDHWIENEELFLEHLKTAFDFCQNNDALMTLGIQPTYPNTGYGYIEFDKSAFGSIKKVNQFREKPDKKTAEQFLDSGNFLWNAGIFVWSVKAILTSFEQYQPVMFSLFERGNQLYNTSEEKSFIEKNYPKSDNISIDYAILEKAQNVYVLPSNFDWNDLGTWSSLYEKLPKNETRNAVLNANLIAENAQNNIVRTQNGKRVVLRGINNFIIVETEDTLLIYPKSEEQDIKKVVQDNNL